VLAADARLGDEEGPSLRQVWVAQQHVPLVTLAILEQIDVHGGLDRGQLQFLVDLIAQAGQLGEQWHIALQLEVRQEDIGGNADRILARLGDAADRSRINLLGGWRITLFGPAGEELQATAARTGTDQEPQDQASETGV